MAWLDADGSRLLAHVALELAGWEQAAAACCWRTVFSELGAWTPRGCAGRPGREATPFAETGLVRRQGAEGGRLRQQKGRQGQKRTGIGMNCHTAVPN